MKFSKFNEVFTLLANVTIVVGIFLVAYELRQNSALAKAGIRQEISNNGYAPLFAIATDPQLATIIQKANGAGNLTDSETERLRALLSVVNATNDNIYHQYLAGFVDEEQWLGFRKNMESARKSKVSRQYVNLESYSKSYQELIQKIDSETKNQSPSL